MVEIVVIEVKTGRRQRWRCEAMRSNWRPKTALQQRRRCRKLVGRSVVEIEDQSQARVQWGLHGSEDKMTGVRRNEFIRSGDRCDSFVLIGAAVTETVLCALTEHRSSVLRLLQAIKSSFRNDEPLRTNVKTGLKTQVRVEMKPSSTSRQDFEWNWQVHGFKSNYKSREFWPRVEPWVRATIPTCDETKVLVQVREHRR